MPAFFSLGIHPAFVDVGHAFGVTIYGYLDDITIVGRPDRVLLAAQEIARRLALMGLHLNKSKCEVYGCGSESLSKSLGFTCRTDGIKVLGAWISLEVACPGTKAYLAKQLAKHVLALEAITLLRPDIAFPLLTSCGIPRWSFIVRTHAPEVAAEFTRAFDEAVVSAFCTITKTSNLSPRHRKHLHLPQRMGGFGLTSYSLIASEAYQASLDPSSNSQDARTEVINQALLEELTSDKSFAKHLSLCSQRNASSWMMATDVRCEDQAGFVAALQSRLEWTPQTKKSFIRCPCGFLAAPKEIEKHAPGCKGKSTNELTLRHQAQQHELNNISREAGVPFRSEPVCGGMRRADSEYLVPVGPLLVDFTICNEQAKSYSKMSSLELQQAKDRVKQAHYKDGLEGRRLKTFYTSAQGGWSNDAISVVDELVENSSISRQHAVRRISKVTMVKTGRMILNVRKTYWSEEPRSPLQELNTNGAATPKTPRPQSFKPLTPLQPKATAPAISKFANHKLASDALCEQWNDSNPPPPVNSSVHPPSATQGLVDIPLPVSTSSPSVASSRTIFSDTQATSAFDARRSSLQDVVDQRIALAPSSFATPVANTSASSGGSRNVGDVDSDEVRSNLASARFLRSGSTPKRITFADGE